MGGLFGGLLEVSHELGGHVLTVLLGSQNARKTSSSARWVRIVFGSAVLGILLSVLAGFITSFVLVLSSSAPDVAPFIGGIFLFSLGYMPLGVIFGIICGVILEALRKKLSRGE
jgi:hypothetical protein